jgi:hypothetical protein
MQARIDAEEANRKRLGGGPDVKFMRDQPVWDHFEKRWVDPEGPIVQSQHGLDALEQEGLMGNPTPSYLAQNSESVPHQRGFQNTPTLNRSPQGLLGPGYAGQNRTEVEGLRQQVAQGGMPQQSGSPGPEGTDRSGWMGDRRFREANNNYRLASMLFNAGNDLRDDRGWWN